MNKSELVKKIRKLEAEVNEASHYNKHILEAHQVLSHQLNQYVREKEDHLRGLKEEFMIKIHALRQDSVKLTNEYRQELSVLRSDWAKSFLFN